MATMAGSVRPHVPDNRFFRNSAFVMAAFVAAGFGLQFAMGRSTFHAPPLIHAHAVVFMGWVAIYVAQNVLAASGSLAMHRKLGWVAAGWMVAMVVLGIAATVALARRGAVPFFFTPAYFVTMNPISVLTFACLSAAAIRLRRRTAWHRRLHYCGMSVLLAPAFGRLLPVPLLVPYVGLAIFAVILLFPLAGVASDLRRSGRVHPAWWWGIAAMVAMQVTVEAAGRSAVGGAIYAAAVAGSPGDALDGFAYPTAPGA